MSYPKKKTFAEVSATGDSPDSGAIFLTNRHNLKECLDRMIFGLPLSFEGFVREVRFEKVWDCEPLCERDFRDAILDNYYEKFKFRFGLSQDQVSKLLWLFNSRRRTKAISPRDSSSKSGRGEDEEKERSPLWRKLSSVKSVLTPERSKTSHSDETIKSLNSTKSFECESGTNALSFLDDHSDHFRDFSLNFGDLVQSGSLESSEKLEDPSNHMKSVSTELGAVEKGKEPLKAEITTEPLGDFIPLTSSSDNDESEESPSSHDQTPFFSLESCVPLKLLGCNLSQQDDRNQRSDDTDSKKSDALDNKAGQICTKRLYSDKQGRSSVFSRLNFYSKDDEESQTSIGAKKRETIAEPELCHEQRIAGERFEFNIEEITERNPTWSEREIMEMRSKKRNVFSRLSWGFRNDSEFEAENPYFKRAWREL